MCRYGLKCRRGNCRFAHPGPARADENDNVEFITSKGQQRTPSFSNVEFITSKGQQRTPPFSIGPTAALLENFKDVFHVNSTWIQELGDSLADSSRKVALIFVDLDNVPRFFEQITPKMISELPFESFLVCSANTTKHFNDRFSSNVHFSLANVTKDAADAICTVAAAKLDSILVQCGRQNDVPLIIVSDDKIFCQVITILKGRAISGDVSVVTRLSIQSWQHTN
jgi:hypothetical protein